MKKQIQDMTKKELLNEIEKLDKKLATMRDFYKVKADDIKIEIEKLNKLLIEKLQNNEK